MQIAGLPNFRSPTKRIIRNEYLQSCDLVALLATVHPAPNLPVRAGGGSNVVNGPFRCTSLRSWAASTWASASCRMVRTSTSCPPSLAIHHYSLLYDFIRLLHAHAAEWLKPGRGGVARMFSPASHKIPPLWSVARMRVSLRHPTSAVSTSCGRCSRSLPLMP